MQTFMKWTCLCLALFLLPGAALMAQDPEEIETDSTGGPMPSEEITVEETGETPLDDVVKKEIMLERRVLSYQPVRESDIFWEKRIWRVIDVREKMNLPFAYPEEPFFKIL